VICVKFDQENKFLKNKINLGLFRFFKLKKTFSKPFLHLPVLPEMTRQRIPYSSSKKLDSHSPIQKEQKQNGKQQQYSMVVFVCFVYFALL